MSRRKSEPAIHHRGDACQGFRASRAWSRRQILQAGAVGGLGLALPGLWEGAAVGAANRTAGNHNAAKSCIFLFMWGGPSQLDTFDLKPNAPAEVRGDFKPVATDVPGLQICQHFTEMSRRMGKVALIRSLHHSDPAHLSSGHATLTGHKAPVLNSDADPPSARDTPHMGSVLGYLRPGDGSLPSSVTVPWLAYHPAAPGGQAPGQHGGWLGRGNDPLLIKGDPNKADWKIPELALPEEISLARMESRKEFLRLIETGQRRLDGQGDAANLNSYQAKAFDLLTSSAARDAFDLSQEPDVVRERYGRNIHGQCVLLARRLIERGVSLVNVNWHDDGQNFWDTHGNNFNRLKDDLIPPADRALAALLDDLDGRGMLGETVVCWVGEFGRRPTITANNAGREHWPQCYCGLLAGGGIRGGAVLGSSDSQGAYPASRPVSPLDYAATVYRALGIDPEQKLPDALGRPLRFCEGEPIRELFG